MGAEPTVVRAGYDMGDGDLVSRAEWREVLAADPDALVYQTPEWIDAICDAGRFADVSRLYRRSDGRRMVLPMVRSTLGSGRSSLPPSWGPGGLVSEGPLAADDVALVLRDLRRFRRVRVRPNPMRNVVWTAEPSPGFHAVNHLAHILDLAGGWETVWHDRFRKQTRKNVRRAARAGVEIQCDSSAVSLDAFNSIHDRWIDARASRLRIPVAVARRAAHRREPSRRFDAVLSALGDACRIWVARLEDLPVAGAIQLNHGHHSIVWRSFIDRPAMGSVPANYLLHRHMIEDACRKGSHFYHLGESGGVESLVHFKERFGAHPYTSVEWLRESEAVTWLRQRQSRDLGMIERALAKERG